MVVPERIAEAFCNEKSLINSGNPWLEQAALADFMHSGSYAAHLLRVRSHYKDNRDCLVAAMRRNFGDVLIDGDIGGLHVLWHLPPGIPDAVTVETLALRARVGVYSFGSARVQLSAAHRVHRRASIILGYAALSPKQIEKGIARLSDAIDDAIDDPATDMAAFFSDQPARPPRAPLSRQQLAPRYRQQPALRSRSAPRASSAGNCHATRFRANAGFEEHLPLSDQGIERPAVNARRYPGQKAVPARSHLCSGAPGSAVRHRRAAMGQERPVRDADA